MRRLLIVEDDVDLTRLLGIAFAVQGELDVTVVHDAATAEHELRTGRYDAVLTDLNLMDGQEGIEVVAQAGQCGVPALIMAGAVADDDPLLLGLGAAAVIAKPFDVLELPDRITQMLRSGRRPA